MNSIKKTGLNIKRSGNRLSDWLYDDSVGVYNYIFVVIAICRIIYYTAYPIYTFSGDSTTYISFDSASFFKLAFSESAPPPVYGIIIDVLGFIAGIFKFDGLALLSLVQIAFSATAVIAFAHIMKLLCIKVSIATAVLFLYACQPAVMMWDLTILTESFSMSVSVIVLYNFVKFLRKELFSDGFKMLLGSLFLIYLRPQFMTYLAMLASFLVLKCIFTNRHKRKVYYKLLTVVVLFVVLILIYCSIYYSKFGVFSLTAALQRQLLFVCMETGLYVVSPDTDFIRTVQEALGNLYNWNMWPAMTHVLDKYGNARIDSIVKECIMIDLPFYIKHVITTVIKHFETSYGGYLLFAENARGWHMALASLFSGLFQWLTMGQAMIASILSGLVTVWRWVKEKRPPWVILGLFAISFTTIFPAFIVTCAEFMRTTITVVPVIYVMLALSMQFLSDYRQKDK